MFKHGIREAALKSAVVGCATVGFAVVGFDSNPNWDVTNKQCDDFQPLWYKCAIVDIAVVDYAVVDWTQCECAKTPWLVQTHTPYDTDYEDCS